MKAFCGTWLLFAFPRCSWFLGSFQRDVHTQWHSHLYLVSSPNDTLRSELEEYELWSQSTRAESQYHLFLLILTLNQFLKAVVNNVYYTLYKAFQAVPTQSYHYDNVSRYYWRLSSISPYRAPSYLLISGSYSFYLSEVPQYT